VVSLLAPFPYFGGKSRIASTVWKYLGDPPNYVEPFAGSLAVLLNRPTPGKIETINDFDGFVANFWRALQRAPAEVARHATNPVNENDLHARHAYLLSVKSDMEPRLSGDPEFYDAKLAGWWAWGTSCWIGSGFCAGTGAWQSVDGRLVKCEPGTGNKKQRPHLYAAQGVTKQLPHLGNAGRGVTKNLKTDSGPFDASEGLLDWFHALASRIRTVRVCCGDWSRVTEPSVTERHGITGIYLDPPYGHDLRSVGLYANDHDVTRDVEAFCLENGNNPKLRIVVSGYEGEYNLPGWRQVNWSANGGMGNQSQGRGRENKNKERLWVSPHCLQGETLFDFE